MNFCQNKNRATVTDFLYPLTEPVISTEPHLSLKLGVHLKNRWITAQ